MRSFDLGYTIWCDVCPPVPGLVHQRDAQTRAHPLVPGSDFKSQVCMLANVFHRSVLFLKQLKTHLGSEWMLRYQGQLLALPLGLANPSRIKRWTKECKGLQSGILNLVYTLPFLFSSLFIFFFCPALLPLGNSFHLFVQVWRSHSRSKRRKDRTRRRRDRERHRDREKEATCVALVSFNCCEKKTVVNEHHFVQL